MSGRPLNALIEVGPRTDHYVVTVGSTDREIVLHDPARAPFRVPSYTFRRGPIGNRRIRWPVAA